jgi:predicted dehydrogenase
LESHGIAEVSALADPSVKSRQILAAAFPRANVFENANTAIAGGGDLAVIASPPSFHRQNSIAAFEAGLDVLCEKPMAASMEDCEGMIAAAQSADRILAAGHYKRFFPAHRAVKILIERELFGPLVHIEIAEGGKFTWPAVTDSFFRKEQTAGGVLLDIGVHVLDLLLWWLGEPHAFSYADDALDGIEANCRLEAEFAGKVTAVMRLSRDWSTPNCYVFRFARATVHCRVNASNQLEFTIDGLPMTVAGELRDPLPPIPANASGPLETNTQAFIAQLVDVCEAVRVRRSPLVSGIDGLRTIKWVERCYIERKPFGEEFSKTVDTKASAESAAMRDSTLARASVLR